MWTLKRGDRTKKAKETAMSIEEEKQMDEKAKQALFEALMRRAEENKKGRIVRAFHTLGVAAFQAIVSVAVMGGLGVFIWNNVLSGLFSAPSITFIQACSVYVFTRLLLGGSVRK